MHNFFSFIPAKIGGDNCTCYDDDVEGHWTGGSCDQCVTGYLYPDCLECTLGMYLKTFIDFFISSVMKPV